MAELDPKTKSEIDRLVKEYEHLIPKETAEKPTLRAMKAQVRSSERGETNDRTETLKVVTKKKKKPTAFETVRNGVTKGVRGAKTRLQELEEEVQRLQKRGNPYAKFRDFGK